MTGPCMCGAVDCRTCGPLQGSTRCGACGRLACDEHGPEVVCAGCGESAEKNAAGFSVCCEENFSEVAEDYERHEPDVEDHHDYAERMDFAHRSRGDE